MKKYFKLIKTLLSCRLSNQMIYQASFWSALLVDTVYFTVQLLTFNAIFGQIDRIGEWQRGHMAVFIGTFTILDAVYMSTYFFGVLSIPETIRSGKLDLYLTKPCNNLFLLAFEQMNLGSILAVVPGLIMVGWGVAQLGISLTFWQIVGYITMLILMYILMFWLMVLLRLPAFWWIKLTVLDHLEGSLVEFAFRVPGVLYKGIWKLIFYVLLPYGLMATFPTSILTGSFSWQGWLLALGVLGGFSLLVSSLWKAGLRQYNSASS